MKHNHKLHNANGSGLQPMPVLFEFTDPSAATVLMAGSFNDWHPTALALHPLGHGHWIKETTLPPGTYEYCLVVDGHWMPDPSSRDSVANPFGGRNSVLKVAVSSEAAHLADAENLPMQNSNK